MMQTMFNGLNAQIPPHLRKELLQRWLKQEEQGKALVESHGLSTASHERRIEQLRAELASLPAAN